MVGIITPYQEMSRGFFLWAKKIFTLPVPEILQTEEHRSKMDLGLGNHGLPATQHAHTGNLDHLTLLDYRGILACSGGLSNGFLQLDPWESLPDTLPVLHEQVDNRAQGVVSLVSLALI
jgi:hypothetical protein